MLRKLIYGNNASPSEPARLPEKRPAEPQAEDFALIVAQLEEYQDRVKNAVNALSRHCHALTVISSSCRNLEHNFPTPCASKKSSQNTHEGEADHVTSTIAQFQDSVIAPMQAILSTIPQLKLRCDHRDSALSVVQRYQRKIDEIKATNRHEAYRLQRNAAKREAASLRFNELDRDIRAAIHALLSKDTSDLLGDHFEKLMELQALEARATETNAHTLQKRMQAYAAQEAEKKAQLQQLKSHDKSTMKLNATGVKASTKSDVTDPERDTAAPLRILPQHVLSQEHSMCPRKKHVNGTRTWNLHKQIKDSMASGLDVAECIQLPENCELEEWISVHVVDFFNEISLLFGTISEFCTAECCPQMTAGPCYTYLWADGAQQLTPIALPAAEYVARLMAWVDDQLALFPSEGCSVKKKGSQAPNAQFMASARAILKRLFRVYAHMYHHHLDTFEELLAERHLNFCFKRFICFVQLFDLIEQKELNALRKLIQSLLVGSTASTSTTY